MSSNSVTYAFQPKPDSLTIIISGSFVIPAGKFAYVTATATASETLSIDGTVVIFTNEWLAYSGAPAPDTASNIVSANYWVPTGTTISAAGGARCVISIFSG